MAKKPKPPPVKPPPTTAVVYLHVRDGYPDTIDAMANVPLEVG